MSQSNRKPFQLSILAAAMLSLSACSTTPKIAGVDLGQVGSTIGKVGNKTMEMGSNAWEGTKNILNIGPNEPELLDEVDLALMEDDAINQSAELATNSTEPLLPQGNGETAWSDTFDNQPGTLEQPTQPVATVFGEVPQQPELAANSLGETNALGQTVVLEETDTLQQQASLQEPQLPTVVVLASDNQSAPAPVIETIAGNNLTHVVEENENLWVIAKATTGDANNWHVIADINNLAPNAAVHVGQRITIPADMLKPAAPAAAQPAVAVAELPAQDVQPEQTAAVALNVPTAQTQATAEAVVATAEQIQPAAPAPDTNIMTDATALKVGAGETLWDFAKRTTGDATNWKLIADKNLFTEKQLATIRPGQKIYVPTDMVRSRDANGVLIAKGAEGTIPTATAGGVAPKNEEAISASAAVLAGTNQPEGEIKIVEAAFQDNKGITPVTAESLSEEAALAVAENNNQTGKVMVSGTYYPKAVYNQADFSSSLLMRVSPGTQLQVSKAIGPWLEVQTDKGVGYVHSRDIK